MISFAAPALNFIGAVAGVAVLYAVIHAMLSPLIALIDATTLRPLRAPIIEEMFKYFILWKFYNFCPKTSNFVKIGFGLGLAETLINFYVVFEEMMKDISSNFAEFTLIEHNLLIGIALLAKFLFSGFLHYLFVFIGIKFFYNRIYYALTISITAHWFANVVVLL